MALIFTGVLFCGFSIFANFVFLNSQMLAIVPCVSIDVCTFTDESFADAWLLIREKLQPLNFMKIKAQRYEAYSIQERSFEAFKAFSNKASYVKIPALE